MVEVGLSGGPWSLTDHGKKAEQKIKTNPYDLESWSVVIREAQTTAIIRARMLYERLVTQFPTSGRYWRLYIEQEMRNRNYEQVEKLFQRCLMNVLHIDLWKCYISYVRETKASLPGFRAKMNQTYDFALEHIGVDFHSAPVWLDYLEFFKTENAHGSFAENMKTMSIRKVYQRAVVTPLLGVEQLWKAYCTFEQTVNKLGAKRAIENLSRQYVHAKRSSTELENVTRGLLRGGTSIPLQGTPQETQQLQVWKRYIAWEKGNPTRAEDQGILVKRVMYAYEQSLLCFGHCAELWYEAALYLQKASDAADTSYSEQWAEEAAKMYERPTSGPLKNHLLLNFAYADFLELRSKFDKAEAIYSALLEVRDLDPTLVYIQYMKCARRTEGIKAARNIFKRAREDARINHHVFVAAALMEYYISKDKAIAFKIFELGQKRFGDNPDYVLAYIDHLSHLNEDNNTRVLFEKVLSSMPSGKTSEIWERFVDFESGVGDLSSTLKVERRRAATLKGEDGFSKEAVLVVDRYKYLNLMPCSEMELQIMGHPCAVRQDSNIGSAGRGAIVTVNLGQAAIVKPDVKQMLPFKPSGLSGIGMNAVPGGHFPIPSAIANLLSQLPPPACFQGPFVQLNELLSLVEGCHVPENFASPGPTLQTLKRKRDEGDDDNHTGITPPADDIYRSRQQKRVHTT